MARMNGGARFVLIGAATVGMTVACPALAQENKIKLGVGLTTAYDSNLLRANDLRSGNPDSNIKTSPELQVDIARRFARQNLYLAGTIGYDFNSQYRFLNRESINLNGGAKLRFGARCAVDPTASLYIAQSDLEDLGGSVKNTVRVLNYAVDAACPRAIGLYPAFRATLSETDNSGTRISRNQTVYGGQVALAYRRPSLGQIEAYYTRTQVERQNRLDLNGLPIDASSTIQTVGVRIRRSVAARLRFDISAGFQILNSASPSIPNFSGFNTDASATYDSSSRLRLSASVGRGVSTAGNLGTSYYINTSVGGSARYTLTTKTSLSASAGYSKRRFISEDQVFSRFGPRGSDEIVTVGALVSHRLTPRIGLDGSVRYRNRISENPFYSYDALQAALSISVAILKKGVL